ncbi:MAG: site-specific integrase [Gammaproteobacteria bacterium]|nr:site-specific integrase [Gammaproteobacteria bacterium]
MTDCAVLLERLLEAYVQDRLPRPATRQTLTRIVRVFTADTGLTDILSVTTQGLFDWRDRVLQRASTETWNTYHRHLRLLGNFGVKRGLIQINPFAEVRSIRTGRRRKKIITKDLLRAALAEDQLSPTWFWTTVIRAIYFTGIRRAQVIGLTWGDIHLRSKQINLAASSNKTDCDHEIPLPPQIEQDLIDLYAASVRASGRVGKADQVFNVTLFNSRYAGDRMTAEQLSGFFRRLSDRLGAPISAHRLRHTLATDMIEVTDVRTVQQQLGHRDVTTTLTFYVHPDMDRMRRAIEALSI